MRKIFATLALIFTIFIFVGCQNSESGEVVSPASNSVRLGETSSFIILSEFFARQLVAFEFEFGEFATTSKFLDRVITPVDSARLEISRDGENILTIFEVRLSTEFTFENLLDFLSSLDLQPAVFGEDSFYFIEENRATNLFPLQNSVLAFQFESQNFVTIRDFISSLLIFR